MFLPGKFSSQCSSIDYNTILSPDGQKGWIFGGDDLHSICGATCWIFFFCIRYWQKYEQMGAKKVYEYRTSNILLTNKIDILTHFYNSIWGFGNHTG